MERVFTLGKVNRTLIDFIHAKNLSSLDIALLRGFYATNKCSDDDDNEDNEDKERKKMRHKNAFDQMKTVSERQRR